MRPRCTGSTSRKQTETPTKLCVKNRRSEPLKKNPHILGIFLCPKNARIQLFLKGLFWGNKLKEKHHLETSGSTLCFLFPSYATCHKSQISRLLTWFYFTLLYTNHWLPCCCRKCLLPPSKKCAGAYKYSAATHHLKQQ